MEAKNMLDDLPKKNDDKNDNNDNNEHIENKS
jgi:hypothetical protein